MRVSLREKWKRFTRLTNNIHGNEGNSICNGSIHPLLSSNVGRKTRHLLPAQFECCHLLYQVKNGTHSLIIISNDDPFRVSTAHSFPILLNIANNNVHINDDSGPWVHHFLVSPNSQPISQRTFTRGFGLIKYWVKQLKGFPPRLAKLPPSWRLNLKLMIMGQISLGGDLQVVSRK